MRRKKMIIAILASYNDFNWDVIELFEEMPIKMLWQRYYSLYRCGMIPNLIKN